MFNKNRIKMDNVKFLKPSSKAAAKMSCLMSCNGDIDKAEKLYKFLVDGLDLPDFDPVTPSTMAQVKSTAAEIFGWLKENQNDIANGIELVKSLTGRGKVVPPASNLPPL